MPEESSQWILFNDGESYKLSFRSALAPDTYVQVATFAPNVPYIIIDTVRYVLNKFYDDADNVDSEMYAEREEQWAPYAEVAKSLNEELRRENADKPGGSDPGQYL